MQSTLGIYISIPFCKAKCSYCNFASDVFAADRVPLYVARLCDEIASIRRKAAKLGTVLPGLVDTIYFGGGTPSLLAPDQLRQIFETLRAVFSVTPDAEITLECAPGQLADATLYELLRLGMNRISFGVQSFVDAEAAAVGRSHTGPMCREEVSRLQAVGIRDINLDLIAGLPHQTEASWMHSVAQAIDAGTPHLSVYMLEIDDGSRLGREVIAEGSRYHVSALPPDDAVVDWYQAACDAYERAGVLQYEISNFAQIGHESRHNLKYWLRQPYVGFGLDAHSMLLTTEGAVRFSNGSDLGAYIASGNPPSAESLSFYASPPEIEIIQREQALEESLFLGLRLNEGVDLAALRSEFGDSLLQSVDSSLEEVQNAGLLERQAKRIRLTPRGRMVSNEVFERLLLSPVA